MDRDNKIIDSIAKGFRIFFLLWAFALCIRLLCFQKYGTSDTVNEGIVLRESVSFGHCVGYETRGDEGAGFFLNDASDC